MSADRTGLFLVFEGMEGAGKSTHLRFLSRRLDEENVAHVVVREPGGTVAGERVRQLVLDPDVAVSPEAELLLYLAARAEFVRRLVRPALERGELVLADRYELSTFAYQGLARGLGLERVRALNEFATGGLKPDGTILLQVDPAVGLGRQGGGDRLAGERDEFHLAVARAYEELAQTEPHVISISTGGPVKEVQRHVWAALSLRWPDRFPRDEG